jgi:hypothetical protein
MDFPVVFENPLPAATWMPPDIAGTAVTEPAPTSDVANGIVESVVGIKGPPHA